MLEHRVGESDKRPCIEKIPESIIRGTLDNLALAEGKHEIAREIEGFEYPLKVLDYAKK
uniref:Uncharacterized protein n=1 Tax=Candidatus Kentrum sp. FW TaxID=2126338 RepID=A0A450TME2_9GAMM|nr:MAG: hypothetical protein BECKFW1821A_GA0114235_11127 [Candidatus Kentron sp. FW]VFJ68905.1 MAG: hypothetical protein BECKFW1821B_GA0114236_11556 [Candidatus Kentron sp. FW]